MFFRRRILLPLAVSACLAASSCGEGPVEIPEDYVRVALNSDPSTLDPAFSVDVAGGTVSSKIYNGLVRFEGMDVVPDLAESFEVSEDGLTYTFHLREGVRFHDGSPFSSADVVSSFMRLLDPITASPRTWVLDRISGADDFITGETGAIRGLSAPDPNTVVIELDGPFAPFLSFLAMPNAYILPASSGSGDISEEAVGTGPFRLEKWEHDRVMLLSRNPDYFDTPPRIEGMAYRVIGEPLTAVALFRSEGLDIMEVPVSQIPPIEEDPGFGGELIGEDLLAVTYLAINCGRFSDSTVRMAMNAAIDRERLAAEVMEGSAEPAAGPIPPALRPPSFDPEPIPYDPAWAAEVFRDGNLTERRLSLVRSARRDTLEPAEFVAGYLRDAGLDVTVEPMEWSAMKARLNRGDFDLALLNWYADYPDAENFLVPLFHSANLGGAGNRARFVDTGTDRLLDDISSLPAGEEREEAVALAAESIIESAPWVFLWYPGITTAVSERIRGYEIPPVFNGDKGTGIRMREGL